MENDNRTSIISLTEHDNRTKELVSSSMTVKDYTRCRCCSNCHCVFLSIMNLYNNLFGNHHWNKEILVPKNGWQWKYRFAEYFKLFLWHICELPQICHEGKMRRLFMLLYIDHFAGNERQTRSVSLGGEEDAPPPVLPKRMGKKVRAASFNMGDKINSLSEWCSWCRKEAPDNCFHCMMVLQEIILF